jgi:hypothetical protein
MSGLANTSARSTQTSTVLSVASHASGPTMLHECKQAILLHGGTWPPAGTKTTSGRSASPATFTAKENSGFLAAISTASSPDELRRLCDERTSLESSRLLNLSNWRDTIEMPGKKWGRIKGLSNDQAIRVHRLRKERLELYQWFESHDQLYKQQGGETQYTKRSRRVREINIELKQITGRVQYHYGMD